jgi:uncharacterized protein (TIGR04206 family)
MELRIVAVALHLVALAAWVAGTWMEGPVRVAAGLLVIVAGGAAVQLLWRHDPDVTRW